MRIQRIIFCAFRANHFIIDVEDNVLKADIHLNNGTPIVVSSIIVSPTDLIGISYPFDLRIGYYALTFVFSGFASSGMFTGRMTYILDIAPEDRRPTYTSFMNAFMLPQGILPVIGGALVALVSYQNMFLVALAFVPISIILARKLTAAK